MELFGYKLIINANQKLNVNPINTMIQLLIHVSIVLKIVVHAQMLVLALLVHITLLYKMEHALIPVLLMEPSGYRLIINVRLKHPAPHPNITILSKTLVQIVHKIVQFVQDQPLVLPVPTILHYKMEPVLTHAH